MPHLRPHVHHGAADAELHTEWRKTRVPPSHLHHSAFTTAAAAARRRQASHSLRKTLLLRHGVPHDAAARPGVPRVPCPAVARWACAAHCMLRCAAMLRSPQREPVRRCMLHGRWRMPTAAHQRGVDADHCRVPAMRRGIRWMHCSRRGRSCTACRTGCISLASAGCTNTDHAVRYARLHPPLLMQNALSLWRLRRLDVALGCNMVWCNLMCCGAHLPFATGNAISRCAMFSQSTAVRSASASDCAPATMAALWREWGHPPTA